METNYVEPVGIKRGRIKHPKVQSPRRVAAPQTQRGAGLGAEQQLSSGPLKTVPVLRCLQVGISGLRTRQLGNARIIACYLRGGVASIKTEPKEGFQPQNDASAGTPQLRGVGRPIVWSDRSQKRMYGADIEVGNCRREFKKSLSNWPSDERGEILRNGIESGNISLPFVRWVARAIRLLFECLRYLSMKLLQSLEQLRFACPI